MGTDKNKIEMLKIKKLKKDLEGLECRKKDVMMSILIHPLDTISCVAMILQGELEAASDLGKSVTAIVSAQQMLDSYERVPPNGLLLYTGTGVTDDGKEESVRLAFEPFRLIDTACFVSDTKFYTEPLDELLK